MVTRKRYFPRRARASRGEIGTDVDTHEGYHVNHLAILRPRDGARPSAAVTSAISFARGVSGGISECIWSMPGEKLDSLSPLLFGEGILVLDCSTWSDIQSLRRHISRAYEQLLPVRHELEYIGGHSSVLWWSERDEDVYIDLEIAKLKLALLNSSVPSEDAFTFTQYFPPPNLAKIHPSAIPPGLAISLKST